MCVSVFPSRLATRCRYEVRSVSICSFIGNTVCAGLPRDPSDGDDDAEREQERLRTDNQRTLRGQLVVFEWDTLTLFPVNTARVRRHTSRRKTTPHFLELPPETRCACRVLPHYRPATNRRLSGGVFTGNEVSSWLHSLFVVSAHTVSFHRKRGVV